MITGCALAAPVVCIKTSEKNFLLYQCEYNAFFFFFEQFGGGEETIR